MRYQTYYYAVKREAIPPFIPGDPPSVARHRVTVPGGTIDAMDRRDALDYGRALYGSDFAGVEALDVSCTFCEDQPVGDAAEWLDGLKRPPAPCPRCGETAG